MAAVEAPSRRELRFWGEEVVQEGFVDLNREVGLGEHRKSRGLAGATVTIPAS